MLEHFFERDCDKFHKVYFAIERMSKVYFISEAEIDNFWKAITKLGKIYTPLSLEENFYFSLRAGSNNSSSISLEGYRTTEPIKSFFFPARTKVGQFGGEVSAPQGKIVLAGVRGCDLHSLKILDSVFKEGDFKDPFYIARRENTFLIGSDCTEAKEVCFCTYFGLSPYPSQGTEGCDLVTSSIKDGTLVESGSEKGEEFLKDVRVRSIFKEASPGQIKERDSNRKKIKEKVNKQVRENGLPDVKTLSGLVKKGEQNPVWEEKAKACVECAGCNMVCPTCHCFLLSDEKEKNRFSRYQMWDSCQYKFFARVAGGANPRKYLSERIRNRFDKKFNFFYNLINTYACTGCGRCIEGCLAKIDLREVLKSLES